MTNRRVEFHPHAAAEAAAAYAWYAQRSASAAHRFVDELDLAVDRISKNPERWPRYMAGTRRYLMRRFPYLVVFREIDQSEVQVVAVAHGRRRPGYWKRR